MRKIWYQSCFEIIPQDVIIERTSNSELTQISLM